MRFQTKLLLLVLGLLPVRTLVAQDLNDILSRHLKARGGEERLRALNSLRMAGFLKSSAGDGAFEMIQKRPDHIRQQHVQQGKKLILAFDGKQAWAVDSSSGSEIPFVLSGIQADLIRLQSDFDGIFLDWKKKGFQVTHAGLETLNGRKTHHLKVVRPDGKTQHFFLDTETYLDQKISLEVVQNGSPLVIESLLSDHKLVNGISFPHTIESVVNGRPQSKLVLDKIELDPVLEDSLFTMPPAPAAPAKGNKPVPKGVTPAKPLKSPPTGKN